MPLAKADKRERNPMAQVKVAASGIKIRANTPSDMTISNADLLYKSPVLQHPERPLAWSRKVHRFARFASVMFRVCANPNAGISRLVTKTDPLSTCSALDIRKSNHSAPVNCIGLPSSSWAR